MKSLYDRLMCVEGTGRALLKAKIREIKGQTRVVLRSVSLYSFMVEGENLMKKGK